MTTASPAPTSKSTARDPRTVELGYRSPTEYGAPSSDGETVYSVRLVRGTWTCTCKGYVARQTCCHSIAAGLNRCQHCGAADQPLIVIGVHVDSSPLYRCADEAACIRRWNPLYADR
ncbi:MAG TPA: hypothetical protein VKV26_23965 [Dehalococcoidia bacterium]|nr:hypothetical protein [Dehalococcoidia bacterium]